MIVASGHTGADSRWKIHEGGRYPFVGWNNILVKRGYSNNHKERRKRRGNDGGTGQEKRRFNGNTVTLRSKEGRKNCPSIGSREG